MIITVNPIEIKKNANEMQIFFFNVGKWDQVTGINSPLYRSHSESEENEDWKNTVRTQNEKETNDFESFSLELFG